MYRLISKNNKSKIAEFTSLSIKFLRINDEIPDL